MKGTVVLNGLKVGKIFEKHMVKFSFPSKAAKILDNLSKYYNNKILGKGVKICPKLKQKQKLQF